MQAFFKNITAQIPDSFIQSNFGLVEYIDGKGQLRPMYEWQKKYPQHGGVFEGFKCTKGET